MMRVRVLTSLPICGKELRREALKVEALKTMVREPKMTGVILLLKSLQRPRRSAKLFDGFGKWERMFSRQSGSSQSFVNALHGKTLGTSGVLEGVELSFI